jgi:signal transduction histidine kinase
MEGNIQSVEIAYLVGIGILLMVAFALLIVVLSNRAQRQLMAQQMAHQALELRHQQELVQHNLLTQEAERQRIAAHLHDDIGSKLGVLHLIFHRLRRAEPQSRDWDAMYEEINSLIGNTLNTARHISHELMPPTLEDFGLFEAIKELCAQIRQTGVVDVGFEYDLERAELGGSTNELNLFRIVQELTSNSLKYAKARHIAIHLERMGTQRRLRYRDDGQGFDTTLSTRKGLGLKNLQSRAQIIGASCHIQTAPGQGFEAQIVF